MPGTPHSRPQLPPVPPQAAAAPPPAAAKQAADVQSQLGSDLDKVSVGCVWCAELFVGAPAVARVESFWGVVGVLVFI